MEKCTVKNVYLEQACLNCIKGSKKVKSHYKANRRAVFQLPEQKNSWMSFRSVLAKIKHDQKLEEKTRINGETSHKILVKDSRKRKVCANVVPHFLLQDYKHQHSASPVEFAEMIDELKNVTKTILMSDESFMFDVET
jgi:hypothetical protein